jgi:hypothetical protein
MFLRRARVYKPCFILGVVSSSILLISCLLLIHLLLNFGLRQYCDKHRNYFLLSKYILYITECMIHTKFKVLSAVKMWMMFLWVGNPYGLVSGYQYLGETYFLYLQVWRWRQYAPTYRWYRPEVRKVLNPEEQLWQTHRCSVEVNGTPLHYRLGRSIFMLTEHK